MIPEHPVGKQGQDGVHDAPNAPKAAEELLDEGLASARAILDGLASALKADAGAAFAEPVLGAIALVRAKDPATWARAKTVLQKAKGSVKEVEKASRKYDNRGVHLVQTGATPAAITAGALLGKDCPAPELEMPPGFAIRQDATTKMVPDQNEQGQKVMREVIIAHAPVLIAGKLRDIDLGTESLDLRFLRPDGWHQLVVDRAVALDGRQITQLASRGFPVASTTANVLVEYLHDLEGLNFHQIPSTRSTSHLGWQGKEGELGFLCGQTLILPNGFIALHDDREDGASAPIVFAGSAPGDEQIADSIYAKGSMAGWLSAIRPIAKFPRVLLGLYVSFVPPLLRILGAPNLIIDWWNRTSTGKTTVLRVAASVWGNPDEQAPDSFIGCWDATPVFIERVSSVLTGLPLLLDETKRAKDPKLVGKVLYEVAQGRGRSRGNVKGIARTGAWRTALLSTGESPATSFTQDGGTRARVLEIHGHPFDRADEETATLVHKLNLDLKTHFGYAGLLFVKWLVENRSLWEELAETYRILVVQFSAMLPADHSRINVAVVNRLAHAAAAIHLASICAHAAIDDLPCGLEDPLEGIWNDIVAATGEASGEERALRHVISWAHSRQETFRGRHRPQSGVNGSWSGRWDRADNWAFIAFYPHVLKQLLADFEYEPESILAGWKERGWLDVGPSRGFDKSTRVGKLNPFLIVIRREAIDAIESES
jgi:putative DNA primase/helicase